MLGVGRSGETAAFFFSASRGAIDEVRFEEGLEEFSGVLGMAQEELLVKIDQVQNLTPKAQLTLYRTKAT